MCRIVGFRDFRYKGNIDFEKTISDMRDTLAYGGPDDAGAYISKEKAVAIGHRRLSILDLSALGHQPMSNDDGTLWITYNGEVYNFTEIQEELKRSGCVFKSRCDTEVILKAYEKWGLEAVHKFRGMFAFAIWDSKKEKLVLCRDRVGVKPLYWYYKNGLFMFSSELKAFHKHPGFDKKLDQSSLALYLRFGYIRSPFCIFKDTHKLEPGHFLILDKEGQVNKKKYWSIEDYYLKGIEEKQSWMARPEEDVTEELENILVDSFRLRMVSDVPVGIFLSGGIDSSLVTALLKKGCGGSLKTFTIGFYEKGYNEAVWAKKVAQHLGTDHTELYCDSRKAFDVIPKLPEIYDEPFGDSSGVPTYLVSKLARQKVKVSLSGDGGDELFCGYTRYWALAVLLKKANRIPARFRRLAVKGLRGVDPGLVLRAYDSIKPILPKILQVENIRTKYLKLINVLGADKLFERYFSLSSVFFSEDMINLGIREDKGLSYGNNDISGMDDLSRMMLMDFNSYLPDDLLTKVDRATMSVSLEGREPLLDNKILEYAARMPVELKYKDHTSKYILRKILYNYVPRSFMERPKAGFAFPAHEWFRRELKELYLEYLNEDRLRSEGILDPGLVKSLLAMYMNDRLNDRNIDPNKLWFLFSFQLWKERWM